MDKSDINNEFTNLDEELSHLKKKIGENFLKINKTNSFTTIQITLRKSLMLQIVIQDGYPIQCPNYVGLHTLDTNSLKPSRIQAIESFIKTTNLDLNTFIDENERKCCIVKIYEKALSLNNMDEFMNQSFSVLETQSKHQKFMLNEVDNLASKMNNMKSELKSDLDDTVLQKTCKKSGDKKDFKKSNDNFEENSKKKFKGSEYVFQRIKWDSNVNKDEIIIGYLDRFLGVKEIKFNDFKGVHDDKEGIPQHRIRYFKINDKIVWDREQRIDLLTGNDIGKFFNAPVGDHMTTFVDNEPDINSEKREQIYNGPVYKFNKDNWYLIENFDTKSQILMPEFLNNFKLLTYNIMAKNNFKKSILEVIAELNYTDSEIGIKSLYQIDRMQKTISLFESNRPDIILLQECEAYEEEKLRESEFIRSHYYICSAERISGKEEHSNCVILSKIKPKFFKLIKLKENSNKQALVVKYDVNNGLLNKTEEALIVNIHLTSSKALNYESKRREQLETLKKYLIDGYEYKHDLKADYLFLCGDFNFGDASDFENRLLNELFLNNGFKDLCPTMCTFDPTVNFCASLTSHQNFARRLDRILFKSHKSSKCELVNAYAVNTAPFEIETNTKISYQPYLNIKTYTSQNQLPILKEVEYNREHLKKVEENKYYLHPSDHFGIECTFRFKNKLDEASLVHKSSLAIIAPKYASDHHIQQVRQKYDPQINRWPPHFNLLYPFYEDIELSLNEDEEGSVIGDVLNCLTQFEAFDCELNEMNMFSNNNVVFLSPNRDSMAKIESIYTKLIQLFDNSNYNKWRNKLTPHLTIAQPVDKRNCSKDWAKTTMEKIKTEFDHLKINGSYSKFTVDCVYWIKRTDTTPFEIKFAFPLGKIYPTTIIGLNPNELRNDDCLLKFLCDKNVISSKEEHAKLIDQYKIVKSAIVDSLENSLVNLKESIKDPLNKNIEYEVMSNDKYTSFILVGSFLYGIKSNDLDFALLNVKIKEFMSEMDAEFSKNLTYTLSQKNDLFHIVRNIPDANVPIIELCLKENINDPKINGADIQIQEFAYEKINLSKPSGFIGVTNLFYDNYNFMFDISESINDYNKLHAISGLFENQNLKKYINNYKDYQVLISFVKYWAKCRNIYGKAYGYMGGISWSILVIYFLQNSSDKHVLNLDNSSNRFTKLISDFFKFYANWNWHNPVSLIKLDFVLNVANKYLHKSPMAILQSVFPYHNTSKNISEQYKKFICDEIERAKKIIESNSKNIYKTYQIVCEEIKPSDISKNKLCFKLEYNLKDDLAHLVTLIKAKIQGLISNIQRECKHGIRVYPSMFERNNESVHTKFKCHAYFYIDLINNTHLDETSKNSIINYSWEFIRNIKSISHTHEYLISLDLEEFK